MYDVIIIGAGVCGCAIARELSRRSGQILVVDQAEDVCCGASKANSGIIHAGYDARHGTLMARLNVQGSRMMPALARELDIPYRVNGSLVVMLSQQDRPALLALYANGVKNGVEGLRILERDALRAMEPNISPQAVAALYAPTAAIVCPFGMTFALAENAACNGVRFQFQTPVTSVRRAGGCWQLTTPGGILETRVVVNAAGVHADELHNQVSALPMTILPRRGEYLLLDRSAGDFVSKTIFQLPGKYGKGVLVAPTVHGNLIVGPTAADIPDKDNTATTREGLQQVRSKSGGAVHGLPLDQVITSFSGIRAHETRHAFFIGEAAPGFVDCAGIESPGLSSAPAIGVMVAQIVNEILALPENPAFLPTRKGILDPRTLPFPQQAQLIRDNPAYGNVVCRCESVTEGEILDAIHRTPGARSLDGVKRRTRAGMGRCQGGFCSPRVMGILSRELGIPMEQITKSGPGSQLVPGGNKDWL